tara:strand:+ start:467 stop:598 length:132 start_codon:yes stop_codon:yes gene_type:complete
MLDIAGWYYRAVYNPCIKGRAKKTTGPYAIVKLEHCGGVLAMR